MSLPITSREYKLTLNVNDKIYTDWNLHNFKQLKSIIEWVCKKTNVSISGKFKLRSQFNVEYMDTPEQELYNNGWIFRIRKKSTEPHNEYTLKFRSHDRYYSACQDIRFNLNSSNANKVARYKFEEDITLDPFSSNFSQSCSIHSQNDIDFTSIDNMIDGWKILNKLSIEQSTPIVVVKNRRVIQEVWTGVTVKLGDDDVKMKVVLWWNSNNKKPKDLLFAELMFRIRSKDENYNAHTIIDAHKLYEKLNTIGLNIGLVSSDGMTKTKYFYGR